MHLFTRNYLSYRPHVLIEGDFETGDLIFGRPSTGTVVKNDFEVQGSFTVSGDYTLNNATLTGNLSTDGTSSLTGATSIGSALGVSGATTPW